VSPRLPENRAAGAIPRFDFRDSGYILASSHGVFESDPPLPASGYRLPQHPGFPDFSAGFPNKDAWMNIYVSNISYTATDEALTAAFAAHGEVQSARIIKDRLSGRSRGFGFVEMPNEEEGRKAVEALNGSDLMGRAISVREARPKEEGAQAGQNGGGRSRNNGKNRDGEGNPSAGPGQAGDRPRAEKPKQPEIVIIQRGMY
jgi:RNA recognition motif-containing protein